MTYVQDEALWSPDHMCQMDFFNRGRVIKPHNIKSAGELMRDLPGGGGAVGEEVMDGCEYDPHDDKCAGVQPLKTI